jgi:hypothetical protein
VIQQKDIETVQKSYYTSRSFYPVYILLMFKRIIYLIGINIAIIITFNILIFVIERVFGIAITPALGNYQ